MSHCIIICAGAPQPSIERISDLISRYTQVYYIGVDRGAFHLVQAGYTLDLAVGDFDSVTESELSLVQQHTHKLVQLSNDKDDTDLEVALQYALDLPPTAHCYILGALGGGRLDHLMANLWLAHQPRYQSFINRLTFIEKQAEMLLVSAGIHTLPLQACSYFSVIGITPIFSLAIQGAKYDLLPTDILYPVAYVSNEFIGNDVQVSLESGTIAIVLVKEWA